MAMKTLFGLLLFLTVIHGFGQSLPTSTRSRKAISAVEQGLSTELSAKSLQLGDPIFMRIFKESNELEVWVQAKEAETYTLFKTYKICYYSGDLGPKTKQGDGQSPEGFYFINAQRFNPWSSFHLSLNMGYPNAYDRAKGYYAMTDEGIEEIYTLAHKAIENGQTYFRVHSFPFRMTHAKMTAHAKHQWIDFWQNMKTGYDWFEEKKTPPNVQVSGGKYIFN